MMSNGPQLSNIFNINISIKILCTYFICSSKFVKLCILSGKRETA